jgi:hypothetical protein
MFGRSWRGSLVDGHCAGTWSLASGTLHEYFTSKRSLNVPITSLEPVVTPLVEQSIESKNRKLAEVELC